MPYVSVAAEGLQALGMITVAAHVQPLQPQRMVHDAMPSILRHLNVSLAAEEQQVLGMITAAAHAQPL